MTTPPEPPRSPDAADLTLAKNATPWLRLYGHGHASGDSIEGKLAQALTAWLQARGIY